MHDFPLTEEQFNLNEEQRDNFSYYNGAFNFLSENFFFTKIKGKILRK